MNNNQISMMKVASLQNRFYIATRNMNSAKADVRNIAAQLEAETELLAIFDQMRGMRAA
ncbi:hypothetical protein GHK68_00080 [Sinorhizobium meliloti]|uniref:hypothetical protein n=1 Tax=Rhizobium meliloti TaxID=382 RepID=UPI0012969FDD|nr:hypothetical protein [Sinorhizobium meliloti]MQW40785.1 hypothetical protein [Sinorhizobium meliloti]